MNYIAIDTNIIQFICGVVLFVFATWFLGRIFKRVAENAEKMAEEEETIYWEKYEGYDGKTYMWPIDKPRSSKRKKEDGKNKDN